jgi:hypothetical protein
MIVEVAMLVVGNEYDGVLPIRAIVNGVYDLRNICLSALNVCGRMLVIL